MSASPIDPAAGTALDVLIVGAGPTGLTLAAQLRTFGVRFRVIDRALDRAHESRALAVQARSVEILQNLGLGDALVGRGNTSASITLHIEGRVAAKVRLGDFGAADTRYPYILFVSQAETEKLLSDHLSAQGVTIERGVELADFGADADGAACVLRRADGGEKRVRTRYLVGCDGAHSTVRQRAGIPFEGDAYLHDFMLGDVEALVPSGAPLPSDSIHSFASGDGIAMFFPLGHPTTWRVIAMAGSAAAAGRRTSDAHEQEIAGKLSLEELQSVVDGATGGGVRVRDPAWLTHFRLHHRQAAHYRNGRIFLAGDAGHIHSPVGAQGMNTGIQDAWNLGWKLALVVRGLADPRVLDSYEAERWPVGQTLLRYTDRIFSVFVRSMSAGAVAAWLRRTIPARVLPWLLSSKRLRGFAFRFISELNIRYRRSPIVLEGKPRLRTGPRAGDRLPDTRLTRDGQAIWLQEAVAGPQYHLLACGAPDSWDRSQVTQLTERYGGLVAMHHLTRHAQPGVLVDPDGKAFQLLGITDAAQYLVRPDGYVAYRCAGPDLTELLKYHQCWLGSRPASGTNPLGIPSRAR